MLQLEKSETEIQKEIIDELKKNGWEVFRMNSGRKGGIRLNKPGTPDLLAMRNGKSIWIELKKPKKKPTAIQLKRHKELRDNGFSVYVVTSLEELLSYSKNGK